MIYEKRKKEFTLKRGAKITTQTLQHIGFSYEGGKSINEIAKEVGVNPKTVLYHLKNYPRKIRFRKSGGNNRVRRAIENIIIRYVKGKISIRKLALEYKVNSGTITRHFRHRGIKIIARKNQYA